MKTVKPTYKKLREPDRYFPKDGNAVEILEGYEENMGKFFDFFSNSTIMSDKKRKCLSILRKEIYDVIIKELGPNVTFTSKAKGKIKSLILRHSHLYSKEIFKRSNSILENTLIISEDNKILRRIEREMRTKFISMKVMVDKIAEGLDPYRKGKVKLAKRRTARRLLPGGKIKRDLVLD